MEQQALHNFLHRYFTANECSIIEDHDGVMKVQLTEEQDEVLMNRPFYWNYVKRVNGKGIPMQVTFITNPNRREDKGEWVHFGSPRIHQMFKMLRNKGQLTRQYEQVETIQQTSLTPWLILNASIHFKGTQKRQEIVSLGLQLINGTIIPEFMDRLDSVTLSPTIPDYCFTLSPIIKLPSALKRIEAYIHGNVMKQDLSFGEEALRLLQEEQQLLDHFYKNDLYEDEGEEEKESAQKKAETRERLAREQDALQQRYEPTVKVDVINAGILYMTHSTSASMIKGRP
ncbi:MULTISPECIES: YqhG family protein [Pontibacillus]|uniref:YqhG family protein n=1 Tax=Pontibacillus chungwhensis TaxID=265426 RepID=A0ABY8UUN4_9BACI|nr:MULTISPECIES: YqhG family protein [Pontibacillus]MCD5323544.1 YqhG family protein [Pontibacillus sp. HN14]WIF96913.1 YqhG family protein [Pontibacillus chungwhensis]